MPLRTVATILLAILLFGCGSSAPVPSGSSSPLPGGTGSNQSGGPGLATGVDVLADGIIVASLAEVAAFENQLVDEFATAVNLPTDLGPETWTWAKQLLRDELARAGEQITLTGASARTAALDGDPPRTAADGGGAVGLAMAIGLVLAGTSESAGLSNTGDINLDTTGEIVENGERSVGAVTMRLGVSSTGSTIEADVEIGVDVTVTDAATGAPRRTGSFTSTGKVTLGFCPDVDGKIRGVVRMSMSGGTSLAGSGTLEVEAEVTGTVGEDAYLQSFDSVGRSTLTTSVPGQPARRLVTNGSLSTTVDRAGQMRLEGARGESVTVAEQGSLTQADADDAAVQIGRATGIAVWLLGDRAQAKWRGGACVEIRATEQSRRVRKNELVQFEARPWHRIEDRELSKKIAPEFAGKASLDPVDIDVPSPVLLSFTAGPLVRDTGTITLTSTSNRGIGTLTIEFTVEGGWIIDGARNNARIHGEKCGDPVGDWIVEGTYSQAGFVGTQTWTFTIGPDERTGTFVYASTSQGTFAGVTVYAEGTAAGKVTLTIEDDGTAQMDIVEETREHVTTTSAGGEGASVPLPPQVYPGGLTWSPGGNC